MLLDRLSSTNCLRAFLWASFRRGFLLGRRPCKPTCCSVWHMAWALTNWPSTSATSKSMLAACVCFLKPASAPDAQHKDSTSLIDPCEACSEWNPSWKTSVWPWPLYCNSVPGCYRTSYSLGHLCGLSNNSNSQILREFFAMRCHVEHPVVSMRELYPKYQILTALIQDTQICIVLSSRHKHEHDE